MYQLLEKLYESTAKFLVPLSNEKTYSTIVKEACRLVGARYGIIFFRKKGVFVQVYDNLPFSLPFSPRRKGNVYTTFKTNKVLLFSNKKAIQSHAQFEKMNAKYHILVPLSYNKRSIGVLSLFSYDSKPVSEKKLNILLLFSSLASLSIRKTMLFNEVERSLKSRDLFIALASHELKTPLTSINAYIQLIKKKLECSQSISMEWIDQLQLSTDHLTKLVQELLAVDKIKMGELHYYWNKLNLTDLIQQAAKDFKLQKPQYKFYMEDLTKQGRTNASSGKFIKGDKDKLLQAIMNLLNNAAKFSPKGSVISCTLSQEKSNYVIKISDQGEGISKKNLPFIFERFHKGDSTKGGMGLGLYLTKEIIVKHKGSIRVESKLNKGTDIFITLPGY